MIMAERHEGIVVWADLSELERDTLVEERVMRRVPCADWGPLTHDTYVRGECDHEWCYPEGRPARATTSWAAAGAVLNALVARGFYPDLITSGSPASWRCVIDKYVEEDESDDWPVRAHSTSVHEAICIAALRAVGIEVVTEDRPDAGKCGICGRTLNDGTPESLDCGGDCLRCMADAGDPDAQAALGSK